jgi:ribosomal protein S18 acetylase RimI-like enzyme
MIIRKLGSGHYDLIVQLWAEAQLPFRPKGRESRERLTAEMLQPHCAFYGAFDKEALVGIVIANWDGRRGWINRLAVHPDYRGRGLAADLLDEAEQFLKGQGCLVFTALIEEPNDKSVRAFKKSGYVVMDEVKYYSKRLFPEA